MASVQFCGSVYARSGYGWAARNYVRALQAAGVPVTISPVNWGDSDEEGRQVAGELADLVGKDVGPPRLRIVHQNPAFSRDVVERLHGRFEGPTVLLTVWETGKLPQVAVQACNSFAEVWVPTSWNRDVFVASGVTVPIRVFGHPHDPAQYMLPDEGDQDRKYTFYWLGAWVERKNPVGILRAYFHAFSDGDTRDTVRLVLKTGGVAAAGVLADIEAVRRNMNLPAFPEVVPVVEEWSDEQVRGLHLHGNCYVSLARGEGWNVPLYEAILYGNAAIWSAWGGHEWATQRTGRPIRCMESPAFGDPHSSLFAGDQCWAEPNLVDAAEAMREAATEEPDGSWPVKEGADLAHLTLTAVGRHLADAIKEIT